MLPRRIVSINSLRIHFSFSFRFLSNLNKEELKIASLTSTLNVRSCKMTILTSKSINLKINR